MDPISHAMFGAGVAELFGLDIITVMFCATFVDLDGFLLHYKKIGPFEAVNLLHYFPNFLILLAPMLLLRAPIFGLNYIFLSATVGLAIHFFGETFLDIEGWTLFPGITILFLKAREDIKIIFRGKVYTYLDTRAIIGSISFLFLVLGYKVFTKIFFS